MHLKIHANTAQEENLADEAPEIPTLRTSSARIPSDGRVVLLPLLSPPQTGLSQVSFAFLGAGTPSAVTARGFDPAGVHRVGRPAAWRRLVTGVWQQHGCRCLVGGFQQGAFGVCFLPLRLEPSTARKQPSCVDAETSWEGPRSLQQPLL